MLSSDPVAIPSWSSAVAENIPPPPTIPTLLVQGLDDPAVLPGSNATFVNRACGAGLPIDADFIGALGHVKAGIAGAPLAYPWFQQRLAGVAVTSTCGTRLPVAPLGNSSSETGPRETRSRCRRPPGAVHLRPSTLALAHVPVVVPDDECQAKPVYLLPFVTCTAIRLAASTTTRLRRGVGSLMVR